MLRLVLAGSVAVLTVLMAVACGGGDSPTSTVAQDGSGGSEVTAAPTSTAAQDGSGGSLATAAPTSTVARDGRGGSEVTAAPTSTAAQDGSGGSEVTAVPTSTAVQDGSGSSEATVAEYAAWCAESTSLESGEFGGSGFTWGETAEAYAELIDDFEDKSAPEELKTFHDAAIAFLKAYHDFTRMQDASEPFDSGTTPSDEILARIKALIDVAGTLDRETYLQLANIDCII